MIVEADRGEDLGHVHATGELAEMRCRGCAHGCGTSAAATRSALRLATADDASHRRRTCAPRTRRRAAPRMERVTANRPGR
ncbi:MAG: hypothetical protein U5K74_06005 [Gemmatimonadaceae bacterium]|nr:hypothetical protein [Gemmatimonadaceae bacterium]